MGLAHALVTASSSSGRERERERDGDPKQWMLFLHGILGSGANLRTFAKSIVAARPEWGAVLVDLRLHGESQVGFSAPHTVGAAAADVRALIDELDERGPERPVKGLFAHSFGGKVALELTRHRSDFEQIFVIDSTPGPRPDAKGSESTRHIVDLLRDLPHEFPDRSGFTTWIESKGVSRPVAMWLAMNVRPIPNTTRFVFRVDVAGIRQLLDDYFAVDLWNVLEAPHPHTQVHLVAGGRSTVLDPADRERAKRCPDTTLDVIPKADHWVHVDAPDELRAIVLGYL